MENKRLHRHKFVTLEGYVGWHVLIKNKSSIIKYLPSPLHSNGTPFINATSDSLVRIWQREFRRRVALKSSVWLEKSFMKIGVVCF